MATPEILYPTTSPLHKDKETWTPEDELVAEGWVLKAILEADSQADTLTQVNDFRQEFQPSHMVEQELLQPVEFREYFLQLLPRLPGYVTRLVAEVDNLMAVIANKNYQELILQWQIVDTLVDQPHIDDVDLIADEIERYENGEPNFLKFDEFVSGQLLVAKARELMAVVEELKADRPSSDFYRRITDDALTANNRRLNFEEK